MPKRKRTREVTVKDVRTILRLSCAEGLSVREIADRLRIGKSSVSTYLYRAREAELAIWPLPEAYADDDVLKAALFGRKGRPRRDPVEPDWAYVSTELKRKGVTLTLLWQEYRESHPDGYAYTWFCTSFRAFERRTSTRFRHRHRAGEVMQTDYAGLTKEIIDPATGEVRVTQIFVAVLGASSYTFATASLSQDLADWIESHCRAFSFFGGVTRSVVCDNLKSAVVKPLWFEPTLNPTFEAFSEHYGTTVLPARVQKPRDKGKVERSVQLVERWILARLRNRRFFSLGSFNKAIAELLLDLNDRPMRHVGRSRRELFDAVEREVLAPLPPFEYAEWKSSKVHLDYHIEVDHAFYSVPHALIGRRVRARLTHKTVEIFHKHNRVACHVRSRRRGSHVTVPAHMPPNHRHYADRTPERLKRRANLIGENTLIFVERALRDRPHPEQGYRRALGILSLVRRYEPTRVEAACKRALEVDATSYASVKSILETGLDRERPDHDIRLPLPAHQQIRGPGYYK